MYLLEECERLQGLEKEAEGSTHNNRHVRKVKVKIKVDTHQETEKETTKTNPRKKMDP
jgi:hypothetical protein